uniref:MULE transposase domain-containing protein n=1 Tax=Lactuca sativa TaxID=4236 RepID=A0A9R1V5D7_LACSA|nr:hypothetical protein LSAT_V11C600331180 [Lactuca sativa]
MSFSKSEHEKTLPTYMFIYTTLDGPTLILTRHQNDVMDRFQLCFVVIGCVPNAFIGCLLSVIFIGSVHLRENYLKTMFVVVAMDRSNQTVHITFRIGMANNIDSCTWFLIRLKEALGVGREVSSITNMDNVISSCICQVFFDSYYGYCCKSMLMVLRTRIGGYKQLEQLIFPSCKSYTMSIFHQTLCWLTHDVHEVLANIGHACSCYCDIMLFKHDIATSCYSGKKQRSHPISHFRSHPTFIEFLILKQLVL